MRCYCCCRTPAAHDSPTAAAMSRTIAAALLVRAIDGASQLRASCGHEDLPRRDGASRVAVSVRPVSVRPQRDGGGGNR